MTESILDALRATLVSHGAPTGDPDDPKDRVRARILEAAIDRFTHFGYRKASIDDIAREAGLGKGTIYLYFTSKQSLLVAAVTAEKARLMPELARVLALPADARLEAYLEAVVRFCLTTPLLSRVMRGDREITAILDEIGDEASTASQELGSTLVASFVAPLVPELPPAELNQLVQVVNVLTSLPAYVDDPRLLRGLSIDAFAKTAAKLLTAGIRAHR